MPKKKALYILNESARESIYAGENQARLAELLDLSHPPLTAQNAADHPDALRDMQICLSGWGAPRFDEKLLALCPNLEAVFYGAGSVKGLVTDAFWARDIILTSSWAANARPVAEYTLAQIILCLKNAHRAARQMREQRTKAIPPIHGAYDCTVGLVSLGMIGKLVAQFLHQITEARIIAFDPFFPKDAGQWGVRQVELEELFRSSDVVSIHTPWLPETENLITGDLIATMKPDAALINTSRGAVIDEPAMIRVLRERPDLQAILDVTYPEPPAPDSPLFTLPNVFLTPHISGSTGHECRRMGRYVVDQVQKYLNKQPLDWQITQKQARLLA